MSARDAARRARDAYRFKANDFMYDAMDRKVEAAIRAEERARFRAIVEGNIWPAVPKAEGGFVYDRGHNDALRALLPHLTPEAP